VHAEFTILALMPISDENYLNKYLNLPYSQNISKAEQQNHADLCFLDEAFSIRSYPLGSWDILVVLGINLSAQVLPFWDSTHG
jgi:hypothetical protein